MMQLAMRNGPNGTSLPIVNRARCIPNKRMGVNEDENSKSPSPTMAPRMKEKKTAATPRIGPKSQPIPSANFTSPKPIHLPYDTSHNKKSGNAAQGPAMKNKKSMVGERGHARTKEKKRAKKANE